MRMTLVLHDGLHYCPTDVYTMDSMPALRYMPAVQRVACSKSLPGLAPVPGCSSSHEHFIPVSKAKQVESEVWLLCLGSPGVCQLDLSPGCVTRIPSDFRYHPFHYLNHKEHASIKKQPAQQSAVCTLECKHHLYMDFGFMRLSTSDYARPNKSTDWVVSSYDGFTSYLLVIDEASRYAWVFLTKSKDPPVDIKCAFLTLHGHPNVGCIQMYQGGKLASSVAFCNLLLWDFWYTLEMTGANSPLQNRAVEIYNNKFCIWTCALLYGAGLPAKYWSAALVHAVYLHNCLVYLATSCTPFEYYYKIKPDLKYLKTFGSRVCVEHSGDQRAKLDRNDFTGIFLGYMVTNQNIAYLGLDSGIVKQSHHAMFDEAWYLQPARPPAAQLLYDLGLKAEDVATLPSGFINEPLLMPGCPSGSASVPCPPLLPQGKTTSKWDVLACSRMSTPSSGSSSPMAYCSSCCSCPGSGYS
jgi:hypothetical protein